MTASRLAAILLAALVPAASACNLLLGTEEPEVVLEGRSASAGTSGGACGDGVVACGSDEECDDGNTAPGDGCGACRIEPVGAGCGDGKKSSTEVCDDGNRTNDDECNPTCNLANRSSSFLGDGKPGTEDEPVAHFGGESGVDGRLTVTTSHLYFSDRMNGTVRRAAIDTGSAETLAGSPAGPAEQLDAASGKDARFAEPWGLATDGCRLWIGDGGRTIREMDLSAPYPVTTIAGNADATGYADGPGPDARFESARSLTYHQGALYVTDSSSHTVRKIDLATKVVSTLLGEAGMAGDKDGKVWEALLDNPVSIVVGHDDRLYILERGSSTSPGGRIRVYDFATETVSTLVGDMTFCHADGTGADAKFASPHGLVTDGTSLYTAEAQGNTIRQILVADGSVTTLVGDPTLGSEQDCSATTCCDYPPADYHEGAGKSVHLNGPVDVAYHFPSRSLFVIDAQSHRIRRIR